MDVSQTEQLHIVFRLVIAGGLGALIGFEREIRGYPAGIRTLALVAMGSALFTDMTFAFDDSGSSRVASQIVVGVGFLGAGVILREQGNIRGMTTAATIWASAAIGMSAGLSLYIVAVLATVSIFILLEMRPITRRFDNWLRNIGFKVENDSNLPRSIEPTNEEHDGTEDRTATR